MKNNLAWCNIHLCDCIGTHHDWIGYKLFKLLTYRNILWGWDFKMQQNNFGFIYQFDSKPTIMHIDFKSFTTSINIILLSKICSIHYLKRINRKNLIKLSIYNDLS